MESRDVRDRGVDIDLERGMDEAICEGDSTGRSEGEDKMGVLDKKSAERSRKKRCRKPPKPPRPPQSPLMDAADRKLVKEISELATMKRARAERMKALKNKKNTKVSSSGSNLCALVITVLFCFIIIWQGMYSKGSSSDSFHGSQTSPPGSRRGLISAQFNRKFSSDFNRSNSASP